MKTHHRNGRSIEVCDECGEETTFVNEENLCIDCQSKKEEEESEVL